MVGKITKVAADRGYGWIRPDGGAAEFFFHFSSVRGAVFSELRAGDLVEFETEPSERGPRAGVVRLVERA